MEAKDKDVERQVPDELGGEPSAVRQRFYSKTVRRTNGCLEWTAGQSHGYGMFTMAGWTITAHRAVWILETGELLRSPDVVMHNCDNPLCVEIGHLRVGTQAENNADRAAKKRSNTLRGENHPNSKFSDEDVATVRQLLGEGCSLVEISKRVGCSPTFVADVRDGRTRVIATGEWRSIRPAPGFRKAERERRAALEKERLTALAETVIPPADMLPGEVWLPTVYEGYFVSSMGRVRGPKGSLLKLQNSPRGYPQVGVRGKSMTVHLLVCETFHGPRPDGMEVAHADGVRTNNNADNLRWATRKDNHHDKRAHGTWPVGPGLRGEANGNSKLSASQVQEIRAVFPRPRGTQARLARQYGVRTTTIANIWNEKFWRSESEQVDHSEQASPCAS